MTRRKNGHGDLKIVIAGGGVIGAAIAYYLAERGVAATVVEPVAVACGASGKSGGFLALDWCDGGPLQALARRSFALHADIAEAIGDDGGYRRLTTYGGFARDRKDAHSGSSDFTWLSDAVTIGQKLGTTATTAQIDPAAFTRALIRSAEQSGAGVRHGKVTGVSHQNGAVIGVTIDDETVPADAVVVAMGPWSILAAQWLPLPAVFGLKGHSIVYDTAATVPPEALFLEYREANGATSAPEVFPRPNGTTYVCAISSETPLPVDPADVMPDDGAIERLRGICRSISPLLTPAKILAEQACYRPVTRDGLPLIGAVPGISGAYIATGHSVWGMLNAPATGEAMAELILDGAARSVDLAPFAPGRLAAIDPERIRAGIR